MANEKQTAAKQTQKAVTRQILLETVLYSLCLPDEDLDDNYKIWELCDEDCVNDLAQAIEDEFDTDVSLSREIWFTSPDLTFGELVEKLDYFQQQHRS